MTDYFEAQRSALAKVVFWTCIAAMAFMGWSLYIELSDLAAPLTNDSRIISEQQK